MLDRRPRDAPEALNTQRDTPIKIRQNRYLNNITGQSSVALGSCPDLKLSGAIRIVPGGIELMQLIKQDPLRDSRRGQTPVVQFYSLFK